MSELRKSSRRGDLPLAAWSFALALALGGSAFAQPANTINLLELGASDLDLWERTQRKSDSRPLTLAELEKLAAGGIGEETLVELMRTRKVLALADADTLLRLKKAGASDRAVGALSAYAVAPNEGFDLFLELSVTSPGGVSQAPYLYIEVWHEGLNRQEALIHADLRAWLARTPARRDRADPLLGQNHRLVRRRVPIDVRTAGPVTIRALVTQKPGLGGLSGVQSRQLKAFTVDYPAVSVARRCRLRMTVGRDPLLRDEYSVTDAQLDCRWD